uniref:EOG090X06Q2 n=1 Tax=Alona affinis TaxID=381656 RepID=A0A9N6ZEG3_9CRUS|nr:EOG090X06Q2 [Alona affinis]
MSSTSPLSKNEKEKQKLIQEKCQTILASMLRDEDNKYCVDCDAKGPRWASWNLGIFLCIRCAGIHRNLGVHISRVKSVNLDSWTPEQVVSLQQMGNSRARAVYEANLPDNFRRPQTDSTLESFIRAKYETKKYIAKEWVCPPPLKVSWDAEIEMEIKRKKEAKRKIGGASGSSPSGTMVELPPARSPAQVELPAPVKVSSAAQDLLGLDTGTNGSSASNDLFGGLLSVGPSIVAASPAAANGNVVSSATPKNADEDSFFNQKAPNAMEKRTLDKNSILALYNQGGGGGCPPAPTGVSMQNMFATPGNMFPTQGGFGAAPAAMNPGLMTGNFHPGMQSNMFSSPMFPSNGPSQPGIPTTGAPMTQLSQQLGGLNFGPSPVITQHNSMMAGGAPLVPGMMMNHAGPMQMAGMPASLQAQMGNPMNPYAFPSTGQPQQQQPATMSTNLWQ